MRGNFKARRAIAAVAAGIGLLLAAPVAANAATLGSAPSVADSKSTVISASKPVFGGGGFTIERRGGGGDEEVI
ncbi:hypothetical protein LQF12_03035 [Ruania suaedae]|uniref:hypothetical protein n=1 Tax=Ruania suaedae TaxID=2897774 RepID=UPI001E31FC05|nr:hypothetical protein [Ruania suaedae]UFU03599.1 hypothetical protein LQF12_03035 [Ruania suaedae]